MFRNQKNLTTEKHRELIDRLGALGGRPKENGVMTHALHAVYGDHPEVASLTPERLMMRFGFGGDTSLKRQNHAIDWHRDMAFERCPAAYSSLRVEQLPLAGGGMSLLLHSMLRLALEDSSSAQQIQCTAPPMSYMIGE